VVRRVSTVLDPPWRDEHRVEENSRVRQTVTRHVIRTSRNRSLTTIQLRTSSTGVPCELDVFIFLRFDPSNAPRSRSRLGVGRTEDSRSTAMLAIRSWSDSVECRTDARRKTC